MVEHLALHYLESLISLENELLVCTDDPYGNKRRLLLKFSKELDYCMQVYTSCVQKNIRTAIYPSVILRRWVGSFPK